MQVRRQLSEEFQFGLLNPYFQRALLLGRRYVERRLKDEAQVVQHDPRGFEPGGLIGVEIQLAMAMVAQKLAESLIELGELLHGAVFDQLFGTRRSEQVLQLGMV